MTWKMPTLLPIKPTNGNDGRGHKWYRTAAVRDKIASRLRWLGLTREPFDVPVSLTLTRVLGKGERKWDADSIGRGNAKELIDSLVSLGWFHDDGPRWIRSVDYRQDDTRRDVGPCWEIEVEISQNNY